MNKVIFLDIDGVLINRAALMARRANQGKWQADPQCVEELNRIVKTTGAKIVVSSTWRFEGFDRIREILQDWGVCAEVIGVTPDFTRKKTSESRGQEIAHWLRDNPADRIVIIDDDSDMDHLIDQLVNTQFEIGLTVANADQAIALLMKEA